MVWKEGVGPVKELAVRVHTLNVGTKRSLSVKSIERQIGSTMNKRLESGEKLTRITLSNGI